MRNRIWAPMLLAALLFFVALSGATVCFADPSDTVTLTWQGTNGANGVYVYDSTNSSSNVDIFVTFNAGSAGGTLLYNLNGKGYNPFFLTPGTDQMNLLGNPNGSTINFELQSSHYGLLTVNGLYDYKVGSTNYYIPDTLVGYTPDGNAVVDWLTGINPTTHKGTYSSSSTTIGQGSVPIPPSAILLGSGLLGLVGFGLRRQRKHM